MRAFSASDLLVVWENGSGATPVEKGLAILRAAFPHTPEAALSGLTIGQRDACLLRLHELTFGPHLKGLADCPACGERLELGFDTYNLPGAGTPLPDLEMVDAPGATGSFRLEAYEVTYRLPTSDDLLAAAGQADVALLRERLLRACTVSVLCDGESRSPDELPADVLSALEKHMDEAEPLANLTLAATCPACGHAWQVIFDVVSYFWSEITAWAVRLLREVHLLASAYGWPEADILAMSAWRRQRYLELIGL